MLAPKMQRIRPIIIETKEALRVIASKEFLRVGDDRAFGSWRAAGSPPK
jgi:hypothetical protein